MKISDSKYTVSVILPVFNRIGKVKRAVESVYSQSFKDFELILADDGSTDGTSEYLLSLVSDNTKFLKHTNRNTQVTLNAGVLLSSGKYITFIDSDDEYKTDHLKTRVELFKKDSELDLIHSDAELIGDEEDMFVPDKNDTTKLIHLKDCIIGATIFAKRKVFFELDGFRNVYSYDSDFVERASNRFNVKKISSKTYIYYRDSADSVLTKMKNKLLNKEKQSQ